MEKALFETTLASIGDAVIATDEKGNITFLNPEAERLTGWRLEEARGLQLPQVFRIINESTRQAVESPVEKVIRSGFVVGLANHALLVSRDGRQIPIDDSAAPIRKLDGPLLGVVLVFRDVTEQRRAQQVKAHLAAIVEFSGDVMITKNLDGIILSWNAAAQRLFGYRAEEIVGKHVTILFPPDRLREEDHILNSLREGRPVERLETVRVAKSGKHIPVAVSVSPLKDSEGHVIGASKVIHDITDLVAAREALTKEKEVLATTLASIGDGVIVTDEQGRVTFMNQEAERLTGWSNSQAAGRPLVDVFRIVNETSRKTVENPVEKVLRLGKVVGLANHTVLIAKSGCEFPIDDSAAPIRRPHGPIHGVVLVFRDFSERKQDEQKLREAHAQLADRAVHLESLVNQRTARLTEMVNELQHVSYAIVHDMRAPLRAMNTFAVEIIDGLSEGRPPCQLQDDCRRIITAAARLDKLIQDTLNYTKAVLREVPLQPVDLSVLLPALIESYPNLQSRNADITIENHLPVVLGEESLLTQCFSNLLGNAVKFVAKGVRPKVIIRAEPIAPPAGDGEPAKPATASESPNGQFVRITIADNGIGLPPQAQRRLFGMFERLTSDYEGTGIGLAIVRKVAERMGGRVGAESEPGKGSRFWVELRALNGTATPLAEAKTPE